jgi:hypothetical protein
MIVVTSLHDEAFEPLAEWTLHKNKKVVGLKINQVIRGTVTAVLI